MSKRDKKVYTEKAESREDLLLSEFMNLAIKRFKWTNLPDGLTSDRLEEMLITHGELAAFKENTISNEIYILPIQGHNKVNMYNEHEEYKAYAFNGQSFSKKAKEIVRLKNNPRSSEDMSTLEIYAKRIDEIELTQEVNLFQQNMPKMIATNREGILTAKNIIKKLREFKLVIFTRDKGISNQIKQDDILDTSVPFLLDKLSDYENFYRNKVLTFLGINNANTDKRERLITSEVDANNDLINSILDMMYECRVEFCTLVKEKFGHEIKVEKREVELGGRNNANYKADN